MASQEEPLEINISTAGESKTTYFYTDIYLYAKKVKQGIIKDERFYAVIFEIDKVEVIEEKNPDFWQEEKYWKEANPAYPISPTKSFMEGLILEAEYSELSLVIFKIKHLNIWQDKAKTWISSEKWKKSFKYEIDEEKLKGKTCFGGLDLASNIDIAAFVMVFPKDNDEYDVICRFWIPHENMIERTRKDKVPYLQWVKDKLITTTKGNAIDFNFIEKQIKEDCEKFNVKEIAYDRWSAFQLVTNLKDCGISQMVPIPQGFGLNSGLKEIETATIAKRLNHGNNKVLTWMLNNVVIRTNADDKIKIDKQRVAEKIDGVASLAMALAIKMQSKKSESVNVYEKRGMRIL